MFDCTLILYEEIIQISIASSWINQIKAKNKNLQWNMLHGNHAMQKAIQPFTIKLYWNVTNCNQGKNFANITKHRLGNRVPMIPSNTNPQIPIPAEKLDNENEFHATGLQLDSSDAAC